VVSARPISNFWTSMASTGPTSTQTIDIGGRPLLTLLDFVRIAAKHV
jgi:hypothetical protein